MWQIFDNSIIRDNHRDNREATRMWQKKIDNSKIRDNHRDNRE